MRSPISSLPLAGSGASKRPAAICSAARASRLTRTAISDETKNPTSSPIPIAMKSALRRLPCSSSNARVSAGGGPETTTTAPRMLDLPKIGSEAIVSSPWRSARKRLPVRALSAASPERSIVRRSAGAIASSAKGLPRRLTAQTLKVSVFASFRISPALFSFAFSSSVAMFDALPTARSALSV